MKKKVLIIIGIILALIIILYLPIPIGEDMQICIIYNIPSQKDSYGHPLPGTLAPDYYIINKQGIVYNANRSFEKEEFIGYLNLLQKIYLQFNKSNEDFVCKLLNIDKTSDMTIIIH